MQYHAIKKWLVCVLSLVVVESFGGVYLDLEGSGGYNRPSIGGSAPTLIEFGGALTAGYQIGPLFFGAKSDFRKVEMISSFDESVGNFRGTLFFPVVGVVGFEWIGLLIKLDLRFLGSYQFAASTSSGQTIQLENPLGARLFVGFPIGWFLTLGPFVEYTQFGARTIGNTKATLSAPQQFYQVGGVARVRLW